MTSLRVPDSVSRVYDHVGPFCTVYMDATRANEHGEHEVQVRWRNLRAQLADAGATDADLVALDQAAEADEVPGLHGLVLVAVGGAVVFAETLPNPPLQGDDAVLAPLPHLVPYLAQAYPRIGYVLCRTDRSGADLVAVPPELAASGLDRPARHVDGERQHPLHKTRRDQWDERHFQNRVENAWKTNAKDVAAEAKRQVEAVRADILIVAGDPRARALVHQDAEELLAPGFTIVDVDAEVSGPTTGDEQLEEAVRDALLKQTWHERREVLEHLRQNLGRERYAVSGVEPVLEAVRRSQVDTVVLSDDPSSTLQAWIGPEALQLGMTEADLEAMGVSSPQRVRFDAALLRAVTGSGANILITPNAHQYVPGGIGALLRYDDASTAA